MAPEPNAKMKFNYTTYYAYSPNGTAEGKLVYVNQGKKKDLMELEKRNISVNGTIVLVKGMGGVVSYSRKKYILMFPPPSPPPPGGGGVLLYRSYMGMCRTLGYGFRAVLV